MHTFNCLPQKVVYMKFISSWKFIPGVRLLGHKYMSFFVALSWKIVSTPVEFAFSNIWHYHN